MPGLPDTVQRASGDPVACCGNWLPGVQGEAEALLCVQFDMPQHWLEDSLPKPLWALYLWRGTVLSVAVGEVAPDKGGTPGEMFDTWIQRHGLFAAQKGEAMPLGVLEVAKPWGRELWFTGVEKRGVCCFTDGDREVPQPWLLAALPGAGYAQAGEATLLLKILDPSPEPVIGDLYFELHREKEEVYVVSDVDPKVWERGVGYLRYGFDPARVAAAGKEQQFRRDYLAAVQAYREVREKIDKQAAGLPAESLLHKEQVLRTRMDEFSWLRPVVRGDVIHVPRLLPHALQHGVQVVEFQTPVYERKILSFAQQVLTQSHWDTEEAVGEMLLRAPDDTPSEELRRMEGAVEQRIALTADFELRRLRIAAGGSLPVVVPGDYALLLVEEGEIELSGRQYARLQAAWLPGGWQGLLAPAQAAPAVGLLLALPRC